MSTAAELAHLFRTLKAPAAARALPKLAERARAEEWSYERFAETLLSTEVASRDAHGGEARIKQARFPARKTLEEFDFSFQRSVQKTLVLHLGQLDFLTAKDNVVLLSARPAPARRTVRLPAGPSWAVDRLGVGSGGDDPKDSLTPSSWRVSLRGYVSLLLPAPAWSPRSWPDQKPVRPDGRDSSQSCHAVP